jgi:hypothetical protein
MFFFQKIRPRGIRRFFFTRNPNLRVPVDIVHAGAQSRTERDDGTYVGRGAASPGCRFSLPIHWGCARLQMKRVHRCVSLLRTTHVQGSIDLHFCSDIFTRHFPGIARLREGGDKAAAKQSGRVSGKERPREERPRHVGCALPVMWLGTCVASAYYTSHSLLVNLVRKTSRAAIEYYGISMVNY